MTKLSVLKSLVDFVWIVSCIPLIPILLFFSIYMFINDEILKVFNVVGQGDINNSLPLKLLVLLVFVLLLISIYCFYLFRKTLRFFQQLNPFDDFVINAYNKIGKVLLVSGIIGSILNIIFHLVYDGKLFINLGLSPYIFVMCLGLFFMVLSETFKIAKMAQEENDLTI